MHIDRDSKYAEYNAIAMRRTAFFAIAVSTFATLAAIIFIPMLYNYMYHIQSSLDIEIDFCQHRIFGLMEQIERVSPIVIFHLKAKIGEQRYFLNRLL